MCHRFIGIVTASSIHLLQEIIMFYRGSLKSESLSVDEHLTNIMWDTAQT